MVSYLKAKKDLEHMIRFNNRVIELWEIEDRVEADLDPYRFGRTTLSSERKEAIIELANRHSDYQKVRSEVSKLVQHAVFVARNHSIPASFKSLPPPMIGGAIIPVNVFESVLFDNSYQGVTKQMVVDALNKTIGACEESKSKEFRSRLNPLNWINEIIKWVLRIPFMLIESTGFNVSKVEDHFLGKIFKIIEIAFVGYLIFRLGDGNENPAQILKDLFVN